MKCKYGWMFVFILVGCLAVLAHIFVFTVIQIPGEGFQPTLVQGDRAYVNRWSYGLRAPFSDHRGYQRWAEHPAHRADWVAFNMPTPHPTSRPDTTLLCLGNLLALPADTLWINPQSEVSLTYPDTTQQVWPIPVPSRGVYIRIHPWNAALYAQTLRQHEGVNASVRGDSLCINDTCVMYAHFTQDYYWVSSQHATNFADSRTMGFIPAPCIVGRVECILYSFDGWRPRWRRFFKKLSQ